MNLNITHPSLILGYDKIQSMDIFINTIDKTILKRILDGWNCKDKETQNTINTIKIRLGLT